MTKKLITLITLATILTLTTMAQEKDSGKEEKEKEQQEEKKDQEKEKSEFRKNLFFGGYIWAQFGSFTQVEVSPQAGYHISDRWDAGLGLKYMYYYSNLSRLENTTNTVGSTHIFGGSVFTSYQIIKNLNKILPFKFNGRLVSHVEYEALNFGGELNFSDNNQRFWHHSYFVGGGLQQKLGKRAFISFLVLYNLNHEEYLPYNNPVVRISFGF